MMIYEIPTRKSATRFFAFVVRTLHASLLHSLLRVWRTTTAAAAAVRVHTSGCVCMCVIDSRSVDLRRP